ncbi:ribosomal L37ae protein family [Caudoviricetes sp.]|nr:ribosomal L37ae protein family [Caudoviricetes sp.]
MVVSPKRYIKSCSNCNSEQSYGRLDHYKAAVKGDWKCKKCSNSENTFKGRLGPMSFTWFEVKRKGGISRNLAWDLEPQDVLDMYYAQDGKCALTDWSIGWAEKGLTATVSIDRIDSSEGYLKGNVQLLHKDVNMAKQQYSQEYFIEMCQAVATVHQT